MLYRQGLILVFSWVVGLTCGCESPISPLEGVFTEESHEPAHFAVNGTQATMIGTIDVTTQGRLNDLLTQYPNVDTIILKSVPGTDNSIATFNAGELLRSRGLRTHVPADGAIASGGTDFFIAGLIRTVEPGAKIGVHSWIAEDSKDRPIIGSQLPRDDLQHRLFLNYYAKMGIPDDFYWFALDAAPPTSVHWMTDGELRQFGLLKPNAKPTPVW